LTPQVSGAGGAGGGFGGGGGGAGFAITTAKGGDGAQGIIVITYTPASGLTILAAGRIFM
jgi:hypothetical protein